MPDLSERATAAELIDDPAGITAQEMEQVLRELELVNRWLEADSFLFGGGRVPRSETHI